MTKQDETTVADGRRRRAARSRQAIIDATLAFMDEGVLVPTAQQIADRAGLGIRSFFRHFEDMASLFRAVDAQLRDSYEALFLGGDREGALEQRIARAVERRARAYEAVRNIVEATLALRWRHKVLRDNYARTQRGLRRDLENWLPELGALPDARREAVDAVTSFEMWHRLREHQDLSVRAGIAVVTDLLQRLIIDD